MESWERTNDNPTWRGLDIMRRRVLDYLDPNSKDESPGYLFCGAAGLGKTVIVNSAIKRLKADVKRIAPKNPEGLLEALWQNRNRKMVIDDCDKLARSDPAMNIVKQALDNSRRVIAFTTREIQLNHEYKLNEECFVQGPREGEPKYNPLIPDPEFLMGKKRGLVWLANLNYEDYEKTLPKEHHEVFSGVYSRLTTRWINSDDQNVVDYVIWQIVYGNIFLNRSPDDTRPLKKGEKGDKGYKIDVVQDVLNFFVKHARSLPLSLRFVFLMANVRRQGGDWQERLNEYISDKVLHPDLILPRVAPDILAHNRAKRAAQKLVQPLPATEPPKPDPEPDPPAAAPKPAPEVEEEDDYLPPAKVYPFEVWGLESARQRLPTWKTDRSVRVWIVARCAGTGYQADEVLLDENGKRRFFDTLEAAEAALQALPAEDRSTPDPEPEMAPTPNELAEAKAAETQPTDNPFGKLPCLCCDAPLPISTVATPKPTLAPIRGAPAGAILPPFPTSDNPFSNPILMGMMGAVVRPKTKVAVRKPATKKSATEAKRVDAVIGKIVTKPKAKRLTEEYLRERLKTLFGLGFKKVRGGYQVLIGDQGKALSFKTLNEVYKEMRRQELGKPK